MSKIPTAKEFIINNEVKQGFLLTNNTDELDDIIKSHIEFAKLHVEEFRKECLKNVKTRTKKIHIPNSGGGYYTEEVVDRKTIRKAYPLTNIK